MFLGVILGAGFGILLDQALGGQTVAVSLMTGMFLGLLCVSSPFFMALRMVLVVGAAMVLTCGLAVIGAGNAWIAVLGMILVVFIATLWRAVPLVGVLLGTFPTILYILILARYQDFTGGATAGRVMLGVLAGILAALIVLVVFTGRDPRKVTRHAAAGTWGKDVTWSRLGSLMSVLRFDSAPRELVSVAQGGILAMIARGWLSDQNDSGAFKAGLAADDAIAASLLPRGPITQRPVGEQVDDAATQMEAAGKAVGMTTQGYAWDRWRVALTNSAGVLRGTMPARKLAISNRSIGDVLVATVLHPRSASFRYGVQKAVALGAATFVMIQSGLPDFYWVLLATFSVMQTNVVGTFSRSLQYAFGTWIGAVAAVGLSLILPASVVTAVAGVLLITGFAWMVRNYMVMCVAVAASVVLLTGAPDGQYVQWAGLRALDVTVGVLIGLLVSTFVMRVHPEPTKHAQEAQAALSAGVAQLRERLADPGRTAKMAFTSEGEFLLASGNLQSDLPLLKDKQPTTATLDQLQDANNHLLALASVMFSDLIATPTLERGSATAELSHSLDRLEARIRAIETSPASG